MYCRLLEERLPQGELPDPAIPLPRPSRSVEAMRSAIPEAQAQLAAARTRLDTISGQLQATRDPSELTAQLAEKRRKLESLQSEYEAIQLAMDALSAANQTLQNRFSPALGARTALTIWLTTVAMAAPLTPHFSAPTKIRSNVTLVMEEMMR